MFRSIPACAILIGTKCERKTKSVTEESKRQNVKLAYCGFIFNKCRHRALVSFAQLFQHFAIACASRCKKRCNGNEPSEDGDNNVQIKESEEESDNDKYGVVWDNYVPDEGRLTFRHILHGESLANESLSAL